MVYCTGMRRPAPDLPITPAMLRHFAILTVAITGCIAMFADGENRQQVMQKLAERQAQNEALRIEKQKAASRTAMVGGLVVGKGTRLQDDSAGSGGESSAQRVGTGSIDPDRPSAFTPGRAVVTAAPPPIPGVPNPLQGYTPADPTIGGMLEPVGPNGLTKSGKRINQAQLHPPAPKSADESQRALDASRIRAGGTGSDADRLTG